MAPPREEAGREQRLDLLAAVLLAVVTILTSWSAFQATKWSGVMAIRFSEAGAARTESVEAAGAADAKQVVDVSVFAEYLAAVSGGDERLARFIEERFRDEFKPAFEAWRAMRPLENPDAPATPFQMPEYRVAEATTAAQLAAEADALAEAAREANQRGDDYVLTTVLFASVLFFAGVSTKFTRPVVQRFLLAMAVVVLAVGAVLISTFPVEL